VLSQPTNKLPTAPLAAASSEVLAKKSKKQKTAKDVPKTVAKPPTIIPKLSTAVLQTPAEGNIAGIASKKSRKRAADSLTDNEEGVDVPTNQPKVASADSKSKKKMAMQTTTDKTTTEDAPDVEAVTTTADPESVKDAKPKKKVKKAKVDTSKKPTDVSKIQASERSNEEMKKAVQKTLSNGDSLTADGVNGVLEHLSKEDVEVTTANKEPSTSMQAEAQRTVDKEMADEVATEDESDDTGTSLLAGFDSDGEDPGEDTGLDPAKMKDLELSKKHRKKLRQAHRKGPTDKPGAVFVGRIPHGFHENEMRQYFSQFGTITNLRLSRNRKTAASKHFAFVEFESDEVAKIVAQTMDNYLMFGHILKCKYAPTESLHPDVWKGANKRFKKVPFNKIEKRKLEEPKTKDKWTNKIAREQGKRAAKAEKMKIMGYEYDLPQIQTVDEALEKKKLAQEAEAKAIESATEAKEPAGAIKPPNGVPEDALALAKEKKLKKGIVVADTASEPVFEAQVDVAGPKNAKKSKKVVQESTTPAVNGAAETEAPAEVSKPIISKKNEKKEKKPAAGAETVVLAEASSSSEPPKFAFHPDEIQELVQGKPKKQKKGKGSHHAATQMQLNTELNEAAEPLQEKAVESDAEVAAIAAVLPTPGGSKKKMKAPWMTDKKEKIGQEEKRKPELLAESAGNPKKEKKAKKSAVT
jgi:nucleolar protein 15